MEEQQLLPDNVKTFLERLKRHHESNPTLGIETSYHGMRFSETPTELFRVKITGTGAALMSINDLPEGLQIENVFCHWFSDGIAITIDLLRQRIE